MDGLNLVSMVGDIMYHLIKKTKNRSKSKVVVRDKNLLDQIKSLNPT